MSDNQIVQVPEIADGECTGCWYNNSSLTCEAEIPCKDGFIWVEEILAKKSGSDKVTTTKGE